jgi:hypothetical protein
MNRELCIVCCRLYKLSNGTPWSVGLFLQNFPVCRYVEPLRGLETANSPCVLGWPRGCYITGQHTYKHAHLMHTLFAKTVIFCKIFTIFNRLLLDIHSHVSLLDELTATWWTDEASYSEQWRHHCLVMGGRNSLSYYPIKTPSHQKQVNILGGLFKQLLH